MTLAIGITVLVLSVLALVYAFMISPRVNDPADMDMLMGSYAHRGLWSATVPENSLTAFELACRHKYGIELDIQLSKDKKIVVFHDEVDVHRAALAVEELHECLVAEAGAVPRVLLVAHMVQRNDLFADGGV